MKQPITIQERNAMVEQNMGLVHACANRFRGRGQEYDDLFQAGCIGLIKAAENFEPERGFLFSTYAVPVILGEIRRIFRDGGAVKVGRVLKEKARHAQQLQEQMRKESGQEPSISELAARLGTDVAQAAEWLNAAMPTVSLTQNEEDGSGQLDIPVDGPDEQLSDYIALREVLKTLDERERMIVELRYFKHLTQSKAAEILGMTQVQVSRAEKKILARLHRNLSA